MTRKAASTLPAFTPVPRKKARSNGWSDTVQHAFIEALADTGSVEAACRRVSRSSNGAYQLRRHPEAKSFRKAWEAALDLGIQKIEDVAMDRALNGVEVPVYAYGKIIGTRRVYNDRLLMFMLRNRAPKRFAADGAKGLSAVDRQMLARLKKEWRQEWEAERAAQDVREEDSVLGSLNAKIDQMRRREEEAQRMMLEGPADGSGDAEFDPANLPQPSEEMKKLLPGYREEVEEDDGPRVRTVKDERWD